VFDPELPLDSHHLEVLHLMTSSVVAAVMPAVVLVFVMAATGDRETHRDHIIHPMKKK